jgi:putative endonuclease
MIRNKTSELGFLAENLAARYLEKRGYVVLELNYRKPWGEIDIIAKKEGILVFVEVKANRKIIVGFEPELRANSSKIVKVVRTARTYLAEKKYSPLQEWQIDIISIGLDEPRDMAKIKHFKNIDV